jgi:hypothetical protein
MQSTPFYYWLEILILKIVFLKVSRKLTFKKNDFGFSSACGAGKPKISFIIKISDFQRN